MVAADFGDRQAESVSFPVPWYVPLNHLTFLSLIFSMVEMLKESM